MNAAEILDRAANLLDRDGWIQGHLCGHDGEHCALGGILDVTTNDDPYAQAVDAVERVLGGALDVWNDAPERTKDEVTSTMRSVAAVLRAAATESVLPVQQGTKVDAEYAEQIA